MSPYYFIYVKKFLEMKVTNIFKMLWATHSLNNKEYEKRTKMLFLKDTKSNISGEISVLIIFLCPVLQQYAFL
jgi:hypothetical protein